MAPAALAKLRVVARRQADDELMGIGCLGSSDHLLLRRTGAAE
jgi:hypothetical protein